MNRLSRQLTRRCCLLSLILILFLSPAAADQSATSVLIQPLAIHADKDLTFLNKGILEMMASRISRSATVIRDDKPSSSKDAVQRARNRKADYVVVGSLTLFGNTVSTDAALIKTGTEEVVLQFSRLGQESSAVLTDIDAFSTQVADYLATGAVETPSLAAPTTPAPPVLLPLPPPAVPPTETAIPALTTPPPVTDLPAKTASIWRSRAFKGQIGALTTGDVDGDGSVEIIVAHEARILVQKLNNRRLIQLAVAETGKRHTLLALDAGDVNGNQKAEIFVTRLDGYGKLDSTVLEWNGKTLEPIADHQPWYFRIVRDPLEGPVLVGQRQGSRSANDTGGLYAYTHFLPGVVALTWIEGNYQAGARLPLPADMDLYRFTPGDIFNDGATRYIAYSPSDELRVYDASGQPQWAGQETLGGSPKYLESPSLTDSRTKDRTYLAQRLEVADLDGDGNVEVITVHNRDATRGWVERFRKYSRGRMIALRWNQVGMEPVWNGEEAGGYISDFCVADVDGDNRWEAVYALVTSSGITQTETSHIVVEPIVSLFLE